MKTYILRRLLQMVPLLLGITFLSFLLMSLAPGDYLDTLRLNPQISAERIEEMKRQFGLDQPWYWRYFLWLKNAVCLNFGYSFQYKIPVWDLISARLFNTFIVALAAMVFAWTIAIPLGVIAAIKRGSFFDRLSGFFAFAAISIPEFFLALLALWFALVSGWFPVGGLYSVDYDFLSPLGKVADLAHHLVLPTLVLGIGGIASLMRLMRGNFLEVMRAEYVTTARAKGLDERRIYFKHVLRNAINPLVTLFGYSLAGLLSGAFLVENVMGLPGLGRLTVEAFFAKDVYLVMASVVMASVLLILGNLFADLMLAFVDPRIRYEK
ncbi:MAG: ABC transporter permease [Verrucomicrobiae bacterium]|nr:ABC transporter permease [Verrucomicrobiae bacterium]